MGPTRGWRPVTGEDPLPYDVHFRLRVLQDAYVEASVAYWSDRAEQLEDARPRRGDFHGHATAAELQERDARLAADAQACRNRAALGDVSMVEFSTALHDWVTGAAA